MPMTSFQQAAGNFVCVLRIEARNLTMPWTAGEGDFPLALSMKLL